jgi:hypothetical protein
MGEVRTRADVRKSSDLAAVIDVRGDVTAASEPVLFELTRPDEAITIYGSEQTALIGTAS